MGAPLPFLSQTTLDPVTNTTPSREVATLYSGLNSLPLLDNTNIAQLGAMIPYPPSLTPHPNTLDSDDTMAIVTDRDDTMAIVPLPMTMTDL